MAYVLIFVVDILLITVCGLSATSKIMTFSPFYVMWLAALEAQ
jgi:hypothetical protein